MSDDSKVWPPLLLTLAASPLWGWGSPPMLWAAFGSDPVVVTPAIPLPDLAALHSLASQWASQMGGGAVPVDTIALTIEGEGRLPDGRLLDYRDAIVVHEDGGMSMFRHLRGTTEAIEYDPTTENLEAIDAMREVGAASWR